MYDILVDFNVSMYDILVDFNLQDIVTYQLLNSTSNGTLFFFLDRDTGEISNRRALTETPLNLYTVSTA